ncbi:MAG: FAD:protein FMN transferase [Muribaculaceae bacterium]|nr:FAD:protein FMN transferase [Muribaculaceae bacterium]
MAGTCIAVVSDMTYKIEMKRIIVHKTAIRQIFSLTLLLGGLLLQGCRGGNGRYQTRDGMTWNTTYHIVWDGSPELSDSIMQTLEEIGASLNVFDKSSLVSKVNECKDTITVDKHFVNVYRISQRIHEESEGAFDPTLSPLITAWGFGPGHRATSDTLHLDSLLSITGFRKTHLKGMRLYKDDPRIVFNFSAIAKGYGCDAVGLMFQRNGVENYLVEIGGEIACSGKNPRGEDWNVQVDRPIKSEGVVHEAQAVVAMSDKGMATSGNYRNFHQEGNRAYGHTISSKTGRPIQTEVLSATVIASNAMEADALATACMALPAEKGLEMCRRMRCSVMLILPDTVIAGEEFLMSDK